MEQKYVVFELGEESYGLPIEAVERILPEPTFTRIPRSPKMMLGVFDIRGETLPAVDLRARLDMGERPESGSLVVALFSKGRVALRVDRVSGIISLRPDQIEPQPEAWQNREDPFVAGIGKLGDHLTVLLDPEAILPTKVALKIAKAAA